MSKKELKNINTIAQEVNSRFLSMVEYATLVGIHHGHDYQKGFMEGVNAVQMTFLKQMQNDELMYEHKCSK